ncbi:hypothetical protein MN116_001252 [Schistosoma mekongi]|uniref:Dehydrogenase/reductase SDR family member 1 n=1 Tax=Schistosoma mekongi TaxID=38744 RepID=A0AAE2DA96_SCHME|nr:hypothetical protein MN116_001252 [Schistosoma mekongi]
MSEKLEGCVCLVTGATRGIGKGIAIELGQAGATVYITGRTLKSDGKNVGASLEDTAEAINSGNGKCVPVAVDHTDDEQVAKLFDRIEREQNGRLDILVNNAYSAVGFLLNNIDKPYFEIESKSPGEAWDTINNVGLRNNYICCVLATKLMRNYQEKLRNGGVNSDQCRPGLIVNVSSIGARIYFFNVPYGTGKAALDRMTSDMAYDLKRTKTNICIFSLWPGPARTETVVTEAVGGTLQLGENMAFNYDTAESPQLSGKVIIAIANEERHKLLSRNGQVALTCDVAEEYNIMEPDGRKPINLRSLQLAMKSKCSLLGYLIPSFIRIPLSMVEYFLRRK